MGRRAFGTIVVYVMVCDLIDDIVGLFVACVLCPMIVIP